MIRFCQFGAGRIGQIHAGNLARSGRAELRYVVDVNEAAARGLVQKYGGRVSDADTALGDPEVDAVIIASSTDTHAALIESACRAGKAIFCEKPIDLDLARVDAVLETVAEAGTTMQVGFNRRFDPDFAALQKAILDGAVGRIELVAITSRDPEPPPLEYVRASGGLFRDMTIHDLDMARWLLGSEPVEVFAAASCLVEPAFGELGDADTAAVTLKTAGGALCQISNSRRAVYGYDQRIEVFGSGGMVRVANRTPTVVERTHAGGTTTDKPLYFFRERYAEAYRAELDHFLNCLENGTPPMVGPEDGRRALVLAEAAEESVRTGRAVKV